jgi:two-component system response regulator DevR
MSQAQDGSPLRACSGAAEGISMNASEAPEHAVELSNDGIRVFILDDHELVRRGLQDLLESEGFIVVGMSGSAAEAARRIPALRPDVAILDARLPDGTGIEVCRDVHSVDATINCLILTSYDDEQALRGAVLAGASGYVLKEIGGSDLIGALRRAAKGESLFDADLKARIVQGLAEPEHVDPRIAALTRQERRVLEFIGEGLTNRQIGEHMLLAEKTVKNYVSSLLAKLGFERRTQAAVHMAQHRGQQN